MTVAIAEKTVTLKTITVDSKRMSFSLLHQLPQANHLDGGSYVGRGTYKLADSTETWGYVLDGKEAWLLFSRDGRLFKSLISIVDTEYDQLFLA